MIARRHPHVAQALVQQLELGADGDSGVLRQVSICAETVAADGFDDIPSWQAILQGARPQPPEDPDPGERTHGWQFFAATAREEVFRTCTLFPAVATSPTDPRVALIRSQSGPFSGVVFSAPPTSPLTVLDPSVFRVLLLRRLRLPLPPTSRLCRCRQFLDPYGDHRSACGTCGVLVQRGFPPEAAVARICREAGARVATNVAVRDLNIPVPPADGRRLEVVANNLPLWNGAQLALDVTLVSPLRRDGRPIPGASHTDGIAAARAARRKARTYPELVGGRSARLVVLALELGGRWSPDAARFVHLLARAKSRSAPPLLKRSVQLAYQRRWAALLAFAAQRAYGLSLLELPMAGAGCLDGNLPPLAEVLADDRWGSPLVPRGMPLMAG